MARVCPIAILLSLLAAGTSRAHSLGAECRIETGRVIVEAYFSDNTPGRGAVVVVRDGPNVVAEGRTDDDGRWSFPAPPAGRYEVDVDAGVGHRTKVELVIAGGTAATGGPPRDEFTRTPWLHLTLGILAIAGLALGLRWWARNSRPATQ